MRRDGLLPQAAEVFKDGEVIRCSIIGNVRSCFVIRLLLDACRSLFGNCSGSVQSTFFHRSSGILAVWQILSPLVTDEGYIISSPSSARQSAKVDADAVEIYSTANRRPLLPALRVGIADDRMIKFRRRVA